MPFFRSASLLCCTPLLRSISTFSPIPGPTLPAALPVMPPPSQPAPPDISPATALTVAGPSQALAVSLTSNDSPELMASMYAELAKLWEASEKWAKKQDEWAKKQDERAKKQDEFQKKLDDLQSQVNDMWEVLGPLSTLRGVRRLEKEINQIKAVIYPRLLIHHHKASPSHLIAPPFPSAMLSVTSRLPPSTKTTRSLSTPPSTRSLTFLGYTNRFAVLEEEVE